MNETIICKTPDSINAFRLLALKGALKLELIGLKRRGMPASKIIKQEFGFKGNKASILKQFEAKLTTMGVLIPPHIAAEKD